MKPVAIPIPGEGEQNLLYPLPKDYFELTKTGQKLARRNACRQWLLGGTPSERKIRLVASTWFFDQEYLKPDYEAGFNPLFYDDEPIPTPEMHWDISRVWATSTMSITIAPRGSAKSTHNRRDMALRLVSGSPYSILFATSTHDNAKGTGQIMRDALYENSRINDDWREDASFGGAIKPSRGEKPTGVEFFYLQNGSWLRCISAESRQRGGRPKSYRLDDPEYDTRVSTNMAQVRDYMEGLLFKVALPMVMRRNASLHWLATYVSRQHYAWHAMQMVEGPDGQKVAEDSRFNHWARFHIDAIQEKVVDGKKTLVSCWPEMWPLTRREKEEKGLSGVTSLEEIREIIGSVNFNSEYRGRPGEGEDQFFKMDTDPKGRHSWWLEKVDGETNPYVSESEVCWLREGEVQRVPFHKFMGQISLFMTIDTAYTETAHSDRRVCTLMGVTRGYNELFVLDMWSGQKDDNVLLGEAFRIAEKWRCPSIHVEVVRDSFKTYKLFQSVVRTNMVRKFGVEWVPSVKDLRPGMMAKEAKISALHIRVEHGLLKLPTWARGIRPWWSRLFSQFEEFNPQARNGGLEKDDEIDTVSMSLFVIKGKLQRLAERGDEEAVDVLEELKKGRFEGPGGISYGMGVNWNSVDKEVVGAILERSRKESGTRRGIPLV